MKQSVHDKEMEEYLFEVYENNKDRYLDPALRKLISRYKYSTKPMEPCLRAEILEYLTQEEKDHEFAARIAEEHNSASRKSEERKEEILLIVVMVAVVLFLFLFWVFCGPHTP